MAKIPSILVSVFVLALGAGVMIGLLVRPSAPPPAAAAGRERSPLADELDLSPPQREQMRAIWEASKAEMQESFRRHDAAQRAWTAAVDELLTDEQRPKYHQIRKDLESRVSDIDQDRGAIFRRADDRTREILTPGQRKKFDAILADRRPPPPGQGPHRAPGRPPGRGPGTRPTSGPV